ncbi:MAG: hypothetical protein ACRD40_12240 [Candidatus Acidiferrales bacterium]
MAGLVCVSTATAQENSPSAAASSAPSPQITSPPTEKDYEGSDGVARLKIIITSPKGHPVGNASVYVRYPKPGTLFRHDSLQELDLKSNMDGSVKVPPVPQGKVQIQVIAKGWHTFGEWYDVKEDGTVTIKLQEPPHWY